MFAESPARIFNPAWFTQNVIEGSWVIRLLTEDAGGSIPVHILRADLFTLENFDLLVSPFIKLSMVSYFEIDMVEAVEK